MPGGRTLVPLRILVNAEATDTVISPIARPTAAELPVALGFRYRMMDGCGMALVRQGKGARIVSCPSASGRCGG